MYVFSCSALALHIMMWVTMRMAMANLPTTMMTMMMVMVVMMMMAMMMAVVVMMTIAIQIVTTMPDVVSLHRAIVEGGHGWDRWSRGMHRPQPLSSRVSCTQRSASNYPGWLEVLLEQSGAEHSLGLKGKNRGSTSISLGEQPAVRQVGSCNGRGSRTEASMAVRKLPGTHCKQQWASAPLMRYPVSSVQWAVG